MFQVLTQEHNSVYNISFQSGPGLFVLLFIFSRKIFKTFKQTFPGQQISITTWEMKGGDFPLVKWEISRIGLKIKLSYWDGINYHLF